MAIFLIHNLIGIQIIEHKTSQVSIEETLGTKDRIQMNNACLRNLSASDARDAKGKEYGKKRSFQKFTGFCN
jgi:hypothetical protein